MLNQGQLPGNALPINAMIASQQSVESVKLSYKHVDDSDYVLVDMAQLSDSSWAADIPDTVTQAGTVMFYISVQTSSVTKTLPNTDPQSSPFIITILPNVPPQMMHSPIEYAPTATDIILTASGEDATNAVAAVSLFYRTPGAPLFTEIKSDFNTATANFTATIPANEVTEQGIEYYLMAVDDFGSETFAATADMPYVILIQDDALPAGCNDFNHVTVCADEFVESDAYFTANGNYS